MYTEERGIYILIYIYTEEMGWREREIQRDEDIEIWRRGRESERKRLRDDE